MPLKSAAGGLKAGEVRGVNVGQRRETHGPGVVTEGYLIGGESSHILLYVTFRNFWCLMKQWPACRDSSGTQ